MKINTPFTLEQVRNLKAGDKVLITGTIYTSRDAGHKRMIDLIDAGKPLPFEINNAIIYYVGPSPAKPGQVIGSAGPTTSYRMDDLTIPLLERGLKGMIGKGRRADKVITSMIKEEAVYFGAVGGAAALIASTIKSSKVIAFDDLGAEALRELEVEDFPAIVVIDSKGNNLYNLEQVKYRTIESE